MKYKNLLRWRFLIPVGFGIWILMWLVSFLAFFVRIVAVVLVAFGIVDLIASFFRKKENDNFKKTETKNV